MTGLAILGVLITILMGTLPLLNFHRKERNKKIYEVCSSIPNNLQIIMDGKGKKLSGSYIVKYTAELKKIDASSAKKLETLFNGCSFVESLLTPFSNLENFLNSFINSPFISDDVKNSTLWKNPTDKTLRFSISNHGFSVAPGEYILIPYNLTYVLPNRKTPMEQVQNETLISALEKILKLVHVPEKLADNDYFRYVKFLNETAEVALKYNNSWFWVKTITNKQLRNELVK